MANKKEPTPGTIGWRADQIRKALDLNHEQFAERLAGVAKRWGFSEGGKWTDTRVSRLILNRKPAALSDAASLVLVAREHGLDHFDWDWLVLSDRQPIIKEDDESGPIGRDGSPTGPAPSAAPSRGRATHAAPDQTDISARGTRSTPRSLPAKRNRPA